MGKSITGVPQEASVCAAGYHVRRAMLWVGLCWAFPSWGWAVQQLLISYRGCCATDGGLTEISSAIKSCARDLTVEAAYKRKSQKGLDR